MEAISNKNRLFILGIVMAFIYICFYLLPGMISTSISNEKSFFLTMVQTQSQLSNNPIQSDISLERVLAREVGSAKIEIGWFGNIHIAWTRYNQEKNLYSLMLIHSHNQGQTWSKPYKLATSVAFHLPFTMTTSPQGLTIITRGEDQYSRVFHLTGDQGWVETRMDNKYTKPDQIVADQDGTIHMATLHISPSNPPIPLYSKIGRYKARTCSWRSVKWNNWDVYEIDGLCMAVNRSGDPFFLWDGHLENRNEVTSQKDFSIYFSKSRYDGFYWQQPRQISSNDWQKISTGPQMTFDRDGHLHCAWLETGSTSWTNTDIVYRRSFPGSYTWYPEQTISTKKVRFSMNNSLSIAADHGNNVYLVWSEGKAKKNIFGCRSRFQGAIWGKPSQITDTIGESLDPVIKCDRKNNLHLIWLECYMDGSDLYYSRSIDNGRSWSEAQIFN